MTGELWDVNAWIALSLSEHVHHEAAQRRLATTDDFASVLFCRSTQQSFLRLLTSAAVLAPYGVEPLSNDAAWQAYSTVSGDDRIALVEEPVGLEVRWHEFASKRTASPKLWMDAYLAAFAQCGGYRFVTSDKAFRQFRGLDLVVLGAD